jgi:hypothetical protein
MTSIYLINIFPCLKLAPGQQGIGRVELRCNGEPDNAPPPFPLRIQVAMKFNLDVVMFVVPCSLHVFMVIAF